ncbi:MAG: outer membrane beta-barrel protein [Hyphomonadaceae bacterium]|nr:outer membrane beta-barrel protein [Hyphomonadaceae bacterium]
MAGSLLAIASPAHAQTTAQDWAGPYVGGHLGYTVLNEDEDERIGFDANRDGAFNDTVRNAAGADVFSPGFCDGANRGNSAAGGCTEDDGAADVGLRAGYDWEYNGLVLGVVGEVAFANINDDATAFTTTPAGYSFKRSIDTLYALRGRVGAPVFGSYLAYGTAGIAFADIERTFSTTNGLNSFTPRGGDDGQGYQVGAGVERKIADSPFAIGAEYLYTSLDDEGYVVNFGRGGAAANHPFVLVDAGGTDARRTDDTFDLHSVRVTATYRFGR